MAGIVIRLIDDALNNCLRQEAARQGCSMEEQVKRILRAALIEPSKAPLVAARHEHLASRIHKRFAAARGVDMPSVPRTSARPTVKY